MSEGQNFIKNASIMKNHESSQEKEALNRSIEAEDHSAKKLWKREIQRR